MKHFLAAWAIAALAVMPYALRAQSPAEDFEQNCATCHTIGGGMLAGPDLAGMSERRERSWLIRFIVDPEAVIESGDPAAQEMVEQYQGMMMPALPGMTHERAAALVDYVAEQTAALEGSEEKPDDAEATTAEEEQSFTEADVALGRELFQGMLALQAGGGACLPCHEVKGLSGLGGGALGPELTEVSERLGGRKGLESWLSAPPTPTMRSLYRTRPLTEQEIHALTAFLTDPVSRAEPPFLTGRGAFVLLGGSGTLLLLFIFNFLWRERLRGVRRNLVETYRMRGVQ